MAACSARGGGEVVVPPGTYLIGSIVLPSRTTLRLEKGTTLQGSPDIADYPLATARWEGVDAPAYRALIHADKAEQIAIVGEGTIIGAEAASKLRDPRGAALIEPVECHGVRIEGVTLRHFGVWTLHPTFCDDVAVVGVTFETRGHSRWKRSRTGSSRAMSLFAGPAFTEPLTPVPPVAVTLGRPSGASRTPSSCVAAIFTTPPFTPPLALMRLVGPRVSSSGSMAMFPPFRSVELVTMRLPLLSLTLTGAETRRILTQQLEFKAVVTIHLQDFSRDFCFAGR